MDNTDTLAKLGWAGIAALMKDHIYPPIHQDWAAANIELPIKVSLAQILDDDIRGATYHLGEVNDHLHRIQAKATFLKALGADMKAKDAQTAFHLMVNTQHMHDHLKICR